MPGRGSKEIEEAGETQIFHGHGSVVSQTSTSLLRVCYFSCCTRPAAGPAAGVEVRSRE